MAWDPAGARLLLLTCVHQLDTASVEEVWSWDGEAWEQVGDGGPPAVVVTGAAFDTERSVAIRYGGLPLDSNDCVAETWEWDGEGWERRTSAADAHPEACDHIQLAYDATRDQTLLVGGGRLQDLSTETWAWDGEAWSRVAETGPDPRAHHGFVFDPEHDQGFLYGGYDGSRVLDDFWSWDGDAWQQLSLDGPGPRSHAGFAVSDEPSLLLFGGATSPSTYSTMVGDTWVLTNGRWSMVASTGPEPRIMPALGHDPTRDVWVLYGGFDGDGNELADTWELDGSAWTCVAGC
jgi:hypothetical protein